uniref:Salivary lipocalin n=1 Tax=Triatoma brasiliensis TaxID=65344 RepID=A0MK95_TRIBS|nr:salivary lipocalin [Triatoma brasiliensis]
MKRACVILWNPDVYSCSRSPCQNPLQAVQNLDINKFFTGSWYATYMKNASSEATCREYQFSMSEGLIKLNATGKYTFDGQKKDYVTTCSSTSGKQLNPAGPFLLKCMHTVNKKGKPIFFDLTWTVIETDYQHYALAYRCTKYDENSIHSGNLVILQRTKTADTSSATDILKNRNLPLSDFRKLC